MNHSNSSVCQYVIYGQSSLYINGVIALPIIFFGFCANVISIVVFTHRLMRSSPINWYLAVLSSSDFLILLTSFLMLCLPRVGELAHNYQAIRVSYYTTPWTYALALTAQTTSVYMTVLMSAHRFVGVCFPFRAGSVLTRNRVKLAIGVVLTAAILFNFTRFFEVRVSGNCFSDSIQESVVLLSPTWLRENSDYQTLFFGWCYTIVMFIFPFTALIVMNSKVIHAVHRTRKLHEQLGDDAGKRQELAKEISTSVMLVGVVVIFLACNFLAFAVNVIEVLDLVESVGIWWTTVVDLTNLLVTINASINIFVYCLFSEKYRALLKYFLRCYWLREGEMLLTSVP